MYFFGAYLYSYFVVHSFLSQTVLHSRTSLHSLFLPSIDLTLVQVGKGEAFCVNALLLGPSILAKTVFASIVFSTSVKHFMRAVFCVFTNIDYIFLVWHARWVTNVRLSTVF